MRMVIKQYNDLCVGEIAASLLHSKLLQATCSQSCMFCFLSFFKVSCLLRYHESERKQSNTSGS